MQIKKLFSRKSFLLILLPVVIYFIPALITISDYNVNWDEPIHFVRGQAYLRFFLTGEKAYGELKEPHSIYQSNAFDAAHYLKYDNGHPPLNGILAALTNYIFFQKLSWFGDIESYHLFIIFTASLLVALIFRWTYQEYGLFAGVVAFLAISTYPLFWAESHNNIKDPVEAFFFAYTLYFFYKGIKTKRTLFIILSSIFAGFALGTKFNILSAPFIVGPWFFLIAIQQRARVLKRSIILPLLAYPIVVLVIFFASWPYLWFDSVAHTFQILGYYREIGTSVAGFNTYASLWILYASPIGTLLLVGFGILYSIFQLWKNTYKPVFLILLWFLIPIIRVSLPGTGIYGGVRQIMEFVPAMAMLAGIGAYYIVRLLHGFIVVTLKKFNNRVVEQWNNRILLALQALVILSFIPITLKLISIHPNENLYFNSLIGGLKGAAKQNFPGWGTTLGNPYLQGVMWLNEYAGKGARLTLALGTMTNIPSIKLREDIRYNNAQESVVWREGEYIMGLAHYDFPLPYYSALYTERYLIPIHEITVEGVPILRIWKNEVAYTKPGFVNEEESILSVEQKDYGLFADIGKEVFLTKIELSFDPIQCRELESAFLFTSRDGIKWEKEPESLLDVQIPRIKKDILDGKIVHLVAAQPSRYVKIEVLPNNFCFTATYSLKAFSLRDVFP